MQHGLPGAQTSVVVARELSSHDSRLASRLSGCGYGLSCSKAREIFPDQGLNLCFLH